MSTILIVGGGGREHALAWRCAHEGHRVVVSPGSDAIAALADCLPSDGSPAEIVSLARREAVDLVIVGPEAPLVAGLGDALRSAGIATFGPSRGAAQLEGSKAAAKTFMSAHGIPTARHVTVASMGEARAALRSFERAPVVKASGLAAGDHLHFAILVGDQYVDPLEWWDARWVHSHVEVRLAASTR